MTTIAETEQGAEDALTMCRAGHRSKQTPIQRERFLNYFLKDFLNLTAQEFVDRAANDQKWTEAKIAGTFSPLGKG